MLTAFSKDFGFALRLLRKHPLFTAAAVLPIALGIGVNTAMFTVGDALLRKPLAIQGIDRLAAIVESPPDRKSALGLLTAGDCRDIESQDQSFEQTAVYAYQSRFLTHSATVVPVIAAAVSPDFFTLMGIHPQLGRTFAGPSDRDTRTVVVGYAFWRDRMGADASPVGRTIELDSQSFTVVGVMPKPFNFPVGAEVWLPLTIDARNAGDRTSHDLQLIGKLKQDVRLAQSNFELASIGSRLEADYPDTNKGWSIHAVPLSELIAGRMTGQYVVFLLGGTLFVLVMACSNVANLLLARGAARQNELAIREALGASRSRMISLLLAESLLIAVIGSALALPLADVALTLIRSQMPADIVKYIPGFELIEMDYSTLLLALAMAVLSGVIAGLTPALRNTSGNLNEVLKSGGRSETSSVDNSRLRGILLVGEVALAMALLVGTSLMVAGVRSLGNVGPGSEPAKLLTMRIELPPGRYPDATSRSRLYARLLDSMNSLPQADSIAIGSNIPYGGQGAFLAFTPEGAPPLHADERRTARAEAISPGYLDSLHIKLKGGHEFDSRDVAGSQPVVIVSQSLAKRFWPNQNPLERRLRLDSPTGGPWLTVVGVASDVSFNWLDEALTPTLYIPYAQSPRSSFFLTLRSAFPKQLIGPVRERIRAVDPLLPVLDITTWDRVIAQSMIGLSYVAVIMTVLGIIAMVLASFGLFGLLSYNIRAQRNEIRIRVALGATASIIVRMVMVRAMLLTGSGIALGGVAAIFLGRLLSNLILGVTPTNAVAYALPALALLAAAIASAYFPAREASRSEPIK